MKTPLDGSERVLCIPRNTFEAWVDPRTRFLPSGPPGLVGRDPAAPGGLVDRLLAAAEFKPRTAELEADPAWKQVVAYVLLRARVRGRAVWFVHRRPPSAGESRLAGKWALGLGGHVNTDDVEPAPPARIARACLTNAARRELLQELEPMAAGPVGSFAGLVYDPSDPVGSVHLGFAFVGTVFDVDAVIPREGVVEFAWRSTAEVQALADGPGPALPGSNPSAPRSALEGWSRVLAGYLHRWAEPSSAGFAAVAP